MLGELLEEAQGRFDVAWRHYCACICALAVAPCSAKVSNRSPTRLDSRLTDFVTAGEAEYVCV
jgi:hypothetical protein